MGVLSNNLGRGKENLNISLLSCCKLLSIFTVYIILPLFAAFLCNVLIYTPAVDYNLSLLLISLK